MSQLKVDELRNELEARGLKRSGSLKKELQDGLYKHLEMEKHPDSWQARDQHPHSGEPR